MKKTILSTLLCVASSLTLSANAFTHPGMGLSTDSAIHVSAYPHRQPLTGVRDIDSLIMRQHFKAVHSEAQSLITKAKRKKQSTDAYQKALDICAQAERGQRGVDRVVVIDSVVMPKKSFLSAYMLNDETGSIRLSRNAERAYYYTQLNGIVIGSDRSDSVPSSLQLMHYYMVDDRLTDAQPLLGLGLDGCDLNYPFLMPDGQSLYFAARSEDGYGNYDLYVTRYDSDSKQFYQAENMGYPYNSPANDYMLVINENANLGWFASDRFQPEDSVCIYTFVPNSSRHTIDYENTSSSVVHVFASLASIASLPYTDEERQQMTEAQMRLLALRRLATNAGHHEFHFVLNDDKDCYSLNDFSSPRAQQLCRQWVQKTKNLQELSSQLDQLRDVSPDAAQQILNLERRVTELREEVHALEKDIRKAELEK